LKSGKFVESLEKIIMSPILIGSKNKDTFVEYYVGILYKKGKLNPYSCLIKELKMIEENYMVV
jgi:E3 ubiquitin-protein ligase HUWE1